MADEVLKKDDNTATVAGGVTDDSAQEIRQFRIDDGTKGLKVLLVGGVGAGTVTSVTASGGLDSTPNPIVDSGTITLDSKLIPLDSLTGNALKVPRVNAGETALEYVTIGVGTVTSVSVVSTNGFSGTVATATTTPAITIATSITGILQGNGTAISAVTIGTGLSFIAGTLSATGSGGTVTTVSVATANGIAGTVATATTTPVITLSTTVTGILKGDGTSILSATPATDYVAPGSIVSDGITMSSSRLLGRTTSLAGAVEEITVGTGLDLSSGTLSSTVTSIDLETNGVANGDQTLLNLVEGTGITLTDDGMGGVTIDATGVIGSGTFTVNADETETSWHTIEIPYPSITATNGWTTSTTYLAYANGSRVGSNGSADAYITNGFLDMFPGSNSILVFGTGARSVRAKFNARSITPTGTGGSQVSSFTGFIAQGDNATQNGDPTSNTNKRRVGFAFYNGDRYIMACDGTAITSALLGAYTIQADDYAIVYTSWTSAEFFINGISVGTITTNLPVTGNLAYEIVGVNGGGGGAGFEGHSPIVFSEKLV